MAGEEYKDCLRLKDADRTRLLEALKDTSAPTAQSKRRHDRLDYPAHDVELTLFGADPTEMHRFRAITRNISATGISVLHGGFVYAGGACTVTLSSLWGERETIKGTVVHCRLIRGRVHELGIQFDRVIDTRCFVSGAQSVVDEDDATVQITTAGTVLLLDDQDAEIMLFEHHLSKTPVQVLSATTSAEAMNLLSAAAVDLFVCDLQLGKGDISGEDVMRRARDAGYSGPILALTGETSAERLLCAKASGAASVLLKPYNLTKLMSCLNEHLIRTPGGDCPGEIFSTLAAKGPQVPALLEKYVGDVRAKCDAILINPTQEDLEPIRELCAALQETGAGFGFAPLSEAARQIRLSLDASASVAESQQEILRLREIVERLRPALNNAA